MNKYLMKKKTIWESVFVVTVIFVIAVLILRKYVFGRYYMLNDGMLSDIVRANLPFYHHMFDAIKKGGFFWSWQMGIGTSMFSHADSFFDPFVYFTFLFGKIHIRRMMVYMFILKLMCEGLCFYYYISYFKVSSNAAIISSIMYAFTGYSMIMGTNFALGTILVYIPLILLGAEKLLNENKKTILFVSLFLTCILSYYFFYISVLGLIVYVLIRMKQRYGFSIKKILTFFIIGVLTIGCSMFVLLPQIELVLQSSRVTGTLDYSWSRTTVFPNFKTLFTAIIRSFSNDALGNTYTSTYFGDSYNARDYFQQSTFVSGLFIYFCLLFLKQENKKKEKSIWVLGLLLLLVSLPAVGYVTNAFSTINARWMYWISVMQCVMIALAIDKLNCDRVFDWELYFASFCIQFSLIFSGIIILSLGDQFVETVSQLFFSASGKIGWLLLIYLLFLVFYFMLRKIMDVLFQNKKNYLTNKNNAILFAMILLILFDTNINYYYWLAGSYSVSEYSEENNLCYEDISSSIIQMLRPSDTEFYRINKSFDSVNCGSIPSENDAMVQGYYGLKNYNSLGNFSYVNFLQKAGCYVTIPYVIPQYIEAGILPEELVGQQLNYINGVEDRYNLMSYLGVKYYLSKKENEILPDYFIHVGNYACIGGGSILVYENLSYMPLVFCNSTIISEEYFKTLSNEQKDIALLSSTILSESCSNEELCSLDEALNNVNQNQERFSLLYFSNDLVRAEIEVPKGCAYISTLIPYDRNWQILIDNNLVDTQQVNLGFVGCAAIEGIHTIELRYKCKSFYYGLYVSIFCVGIVILLLVYYLVKNERNKKYEY